VQPDDCPFSLNFPRSRIVVRIVTAGPGLQAGLCAFVTFVSPHPGSSCPDESLMEVTSAGPRVRLGYIYSLRWLEL
jgi:hypothetical protein